MVIVTDRRESENDGAVEHHPFPFESSSTFDVTVSIGNDLEPPFPSVVIDARVNRGEVERRRRE